MFVYLIDADLTSNIVLLSAYLLAVSSFLNDCFTYMRGLY